MSKRRKVMVAMVTCLMAVMMLGGTVLAGTQYEHAFGIPANGQKSWDAKGARYRPATDGNDPWQVRMMITTDPYDLVTIFWLEQDGLRYRVSGDVVVTHGPGFYFNNPYSTANKQMVLLTARDNRTDNVSYWLGGQWLPSTW